jgi:hypothetical protein
LSESTTAINPPEIKLDLTGIELRNNARKEMKSDAAPGPWRVKVNKYRAGTKYEVSRITLPTEPDGGGKEETMVAEGYDRHNKEFIAFARNDAPETDIDQLIAKIREMEGYMQERERFIETIALLETEVRDLKQQMSDLVTNHEAQVVALTTENQRVSEALNMYVVRTEAIHQAGAMLQTVLAFYAEDKNWEWHFVSNRMLKDHGQTARQALEDFWSSVDSASPRD